MVIRQAVPKDKPRLLAISAGIWDGYDYIPHVADYWLSGEGGTTLGIEIDQTLLGFARLTALSESTCWLEGIRVDAAARGLGLGKALTEAMVKLAMEKGYRHIELSSFIENYESLSIVRSRGFVEKAAFKFYELPEAEVAEEVQPKALGVQLIELPRSLLRQPEAFEALYQRIINAEGFNSRKGYFSYDWTFKAFERSDLKALIEIGGLYELCWQVENNWLNQVPNCSLMALSNRFSKGNYETLHWVERPEFVEVSLNIATRRARTLNQSFNCMLPVGESLYAKAIEGLESLSEAEEDVFVFYYK